jgi:hypothetical protein
VNLGKPLGGSLLERPPAILALLPLLVQLNCMVRTNKRTHQQTNKYGMTIMVMNIIIDLIEEEGQGTRKWRAMHVSDRAHGLGRYTHYHGTGQQRERASRNGTMDLWSDGPPFRRLDHPRLNITYKQTYLDESACSISNHNHHHPPPPPPTALPSRQLHVHRH